jgi:hypothetical protein
MEKSNKGQNGNLIQMRQAIEGLCIFRTNFGKVVGGENKEDSIQIGRGDQKNSVRFGIPFTVSGIESIQFRNDLP